MVGRHSSRYHLFLLLTTSLCSPSRERLKTTPSPQPKSTNKTNPNNNQERHKRANIKHLLQNDFCLIAINNCVKVQLKLYVKTVCRENRLSIGSCILFWCQFLLFMEGGKKIIKNQQFLPRTASLKTFLFAQICYHL